MNPDRKNNEGYYVEVPEEKRIVFPERCLICGENTNGRRVEVQGNPTGYFGGWKWQLGMSPKISVPAHIQCGSKLKNNVLFRNVILFLLAAIALIVGIYFNLGRGETIGLCLALIIIPIYWQVKNAPPFEFTCENKFYEFRFANKEYAEEFANLNNVSVED